MTIKQRFDLERDDRRRESTQARLADRLKFACCRQCGTEDGMRAMPREILTDMADHKIRLLAPWYRYRQSLTDEHLYYPCSRCNRSAVRDRPVTIPGDFVLVPINEVLTVWRITDLMQPDYAALAAEEPVLASEMDRDSAGLEG